MFCQSIDSGQSYLINVGVPHFGEEAESRWRVRVVDGELDPSLRVREDTSSMREAGSLSTLSPCFCFPNRQLVKTTL